MAIDSARDEAGTGTDTGSGRLARRAAFAGGALAVLLLAAALLLPQVVDAERYRDRIAALASAAIGREVVLGGAMSLRLLPSPALSAAEATIANLEGGRAPFMARLERLDIVLALLPLLRGEIRVRRVDLVGPDIALERLADGRVNWSLGGSGDESAPAARHIELEALALRGGRLSWNDFVSGKSIRLEDIEARLAARLPWGPLDIAAQAISAGVPLTLELESRELVEGVRAPLNARLGIGKAAIAWSGHLRRGPAGVLPGAGGKLTVEGPSLGALLGDAARIAGRPHIAGGALDKPFSAASAVTLDGALELADIAGKLGETTFAGTARLDPGGGPAIALDLRADRLVLDDFVGGAPAAGPDFAVGETLLPAGMKLDLTLALDALRWRDGTLDDLRLRAEGRDGAIELVEIGMRTPGAGKLAFEVRAAARAGVPVFVGRFAADAADLPALLRWLGAGDAVAGAEMFGFALTAGIELAPDRLALSGLELRLDRMTLAGDAALERAGASVRLDADLALDRLDLDRWLPHDPAAPPLGLADLAAGIDHMLVASRPHGGRVALRAGRVDFAGDTFREVVLRAAGSAGAIAIEEARIGELPGGSAFLSGRLESGGSGDAGPVFDLALRLAGDRPERLARLFGLTLPVAAPEALAPLDVEGTLAGNMASAALDIAAGIAGGRLTARGTIGRPAAAAPGPFDLDLVLAHPSHRALAERFGIAALAEGEALPLRLRARLGGDAQALALRLDGTALGGTVSAEGGFDAARGAAPWIFALAADHPSLDRLLRQFDAARPVRVEPPRTVALAARYSGGADGFKLTDIALAAGRSDLAGELEVATGGTRPSFYATLSAGTIDLADFLVPDESAAAQERWSRTPFSLDGLKGADGRLLLRAGSLVHEPWRLDELDLAAQLEAGVLTVERLGGRLFGGRLEAAGKLDARELPALELRLGIEDAGLGPVLRATSGLAVASGRLDVEGSFSGRGTSQFSMISDLSGEARLEARDAVLEGIDLPRLAAGIGELRRAADLPRLFGAALAGGRTPFAAGNLHLRAENGQLTGDDLELVAERYRLRGSGAVDLAAWSVDGRAEVGFPGHPGAPPLGLVALGNLSAPRLLLDDGPLRSWAARRIAGEALQRIPLPARPPAAPEIVGAGDPEPAPGKEKRDEETPPASVMKRFLDALGTAAAGPEPGGGGP